QINLFSGDTCRPRCRGCFASASIFFIRRLISASQDSLYFFLFIYKTGVSRQFYGGTPAKWGSNIVVPASPVDNEKYVLLSGGNVCG
ncbi:MAG: hypothetical protein LBP60_03010, partial [Spirochaetaceae bacterium]|nr:hypothetical protein [Spirochaetaceae bacterium]